MPSIGVDAAAVCHCMFTLGDAFSGAPHRSGGRSPGLCLTPQQGAERCRDRSPHLREGMGWGPGSRLVTGLASSLPSCRWLDTREFPGPPAPSLLKAGGVEAPLHPATHTKAGAGASRWDCGLWTCGRQADHPTELHEAPPISEHPRFFCLSWDRAHLHRALVQALLLATWEEKELGGREEPLGAYVERPGAGMLTLSGSPTLGTT